MPNWHVRDFSFEDLEAAIALDGLSTTTAHRPLFGVSDVVSSFQARNPAVVAVSDGVVIGVTVSRVDGDRAWIIRMSLDPEWRGRGVGSSLLGELEHRLVSLGIHRITALLPAGETTSAAFENSGFTPRFGMMHYEKEETVSAYAAGVLNRLGGAVPPAGLWDRIAGMTDEKRLIDRRMVLPLSRPEQAADHGVTPPQAVVLFGPPGTGKTTFAKAIASRLGWPFVELFPSRLSSGNGGLSAGLSEAFLQLRELDSVVVFIDEVEEVAAQRDPGSLSAAVVNELLKSIVSFKERPNRILVCATNSVRALDTAFLRHGRFDYVVPIGAPDAMAREALWKKYLDSSEVDVTALVKATDGYTPADVAHVSRAVAQQTFERSVDSNQPCQSTTDDYLSVIAVTRPTLTDTLVSEFESDRITFSRI